MPTTSYSRHDRLPRHWLVCLAALVAIVPARGLAQDGAPAETAQPSQQPSRPQETLLDKLLARALEANPDVRAALAQLAAAEVELERVRLEVTRAVIAAHAALEAQKQEVEAAKVRARQAAVAVQQAKIDELRGDEIELRKAKLEEYGVMVQVAQAKIADLQATLDYLVGGAGQNSYYGYSSLTLTGPVPPQAAPPSPADTEDPALIEMYARLRTRGELPVKIEVLDMPLVDVLNYLQDATTFRLVLQQGMIEKLAQEMSDESGADVDLLEKPLSLYLEQVPFRSALVALQDQAPWLRFVVRPYGILVTTEQGLPSGALTVEEFYRQDRKKK